MHKISYQQMCIDIQFMSNDELMQQLNLMKVNMTYPELVAMLKQNFSDLLVSDQLFRTYPIDDQESVYKKEFVDEAVLQIAKRNTFSFQHYGILVEQLQEVNQRKLVDEDTLSYKLDLYKQLFHLANTFHLDHFDAMVYAVNDGFDLGNDWVSTLHALIKQNPKETLEMISKFQRVFLIRNPYIEDQMTIIEVMAFFILNSKKAETYFHRAITQEVDICELFYYTSPYMNPIQKQRFYHKYKKQMDQSSCYYQKITNEIE